ncbi:FBD-associated F-box protein At5g22730 isoform X1 [Capsella rubella]|uniref:FBD-associated F-box protein At5g22730 isoform X1 n=1 Tax=Capsella rubella TaxID=81985 RepID=UPI000CD4F8C1|nr:FBD-associated F-box protein At5g22730 isoform X1 [Capsella rubella]XP_023636251.1 FBD-associated F-box protein At5g22730 isoform X1 [Capsella rubella]XP_023636252.1 FBD-associated F-box protein At5g22730 isoform X1 [Capsella rubella]
MLRGYSDYIEYMKTKQVCREWPPAPGSYISGREDLISKLPDSLISEILMYLPTKEAVRTSVLSTRWKSLWLLIPKLDLVASEFPDSSAFVNFMDRFIDFSREHKSCLHKLKLSSRKNVNDPHCVARWIDFLVRRNLQHLDVECLVNRKFLEEMPLSLYVCDTLVYLRLHRVSLGKFESVSLTCLKTMHLEENVYANDVVLESLISSCPLLEHLSILRMVQDNVKVLRVHSQTLTSLRIDFYFGEDDDYVDDFDKKDSGVLIDAPRLEYLKFEDDLSESKIITNSGSLAKVNVVYVFNEHDSADVADLPKRNMVRNFLTSISGVRDMKISEPFVEFLYYNIDFDPLPQFCNLSCLKAKFSLHYLEILPTLLESFPHLKSLVLVLDFDQEREDEDVQISFSSVPRCLVSSLEFVEMKYFNGGPAKMEVARYFLENSGVLKKLVLHLRCFSHEEGFYMLKDLLALPRGSSTCQTIVC